MNNGKPFLVLTFFMLLIALFAGGAMSNVDLTPNTPPAGNITGDNLPLTGIRSVSAGSCGSVYTVRSGDTLSRIAQNCGTTLSDLLAVNPAIYNANLIRPGQKINLMYRVTETPVPTPTTQPSSTPGDPPITGLRPGGKVMIVMEGFPAKAPVVVTLGPAGGEPRYRTEVFTDARGKLNMRMDIPVTAQPGESWVVKVQTINPPNVTVSGQPFTIEK